MELRPECKAPGYGVAVIPGRTPTPRRMSLPLTFTHRARASLLPLSRERQSLAAACAEWAYTGAARDVAALPQPCAVCTRDGRHVLYELANGGTGATLWVGRECVVRFRCGGDATPTTRDRARDDGRAARDRGRMDRVRATLRAIRAVEPTFNAASMIAAVERLGRFTPSQLDLAARFLVRHGIAWDPADFRVSIRRDEHRRQLLDLPLWRYERIRRALSPEQQQSYECGQVPRRVPPPPAAPARLPSAP